MSRKPGKPAPRADDDSGWPVTPTGQTVIVDDDGPIDTGLYDPTGAKIFRPSPRGPLGFQIPKRRA